MADPLTAGLAIGSAIFSGIQAENQASARAQALQLREQQEEIAARQRSTQRTSQVNRVLAEQVALQSARGVALTSPSFQAIQVETLNQFAQDQNADALNLGFQKQAIGQAEENARLAGDVGFAGSLFDAANIFKNSLPAGPRIGAQAALPAQPRVEI